MFLVQKIFELSGSPALKQEVLHRRRSLKGARKAKKCGHCHQWRSSTTQLLTHPCPYKLVLPYCQRPAADANFAFITSARNEEDEYAGRLFEIFADIHDPSAKFLQELRTLLRIEQ